MALTSFALYRKYRPASFKDVRNQEHIVNVLKGAIEKKMIPHALLFTGSRGTGKTTVARIFAHEIGASDIDIYEIDAASNRGIDDIRALKEAVNTLPYESPYKVYIIDEVHMLTKEAFNALLKTLEEPPQYVVFILATTEQDKLLETITSRCQIFKFRSPSRVELKDTILDVAKKEGVKITEGGADTIALAADGSYRDALSIMQKVIMTSKDAALDGDEIALIVGAPREVLIRECLTALQSKNAKGALVALRAASDSHVDMKIFLTMLLERIRAVLLLRHGAVPDNVLEQYSTEERELISTCAKDARSPLNSALLLRFLDAGDRINSSQVKVLPLELAVLESLS